VLRPLTREQSTYNRAVLITLDELTTHVLSMRRQFEQRLTAGQALLASTELLLEESRQEVRVLDTRVAGLQAELAGVSRKRIADGGELLAQRSRIDILLAEARRRLPEAFDNEQLATIAGQSAVDPRAAEIRAALEERFDDQSRTRTRQTEHLAHFAGLRGHSTPVLDLGSGRGEWLDLLAEHGIPAYGVDDDPAAAGAGRARGLDLRAEDCVGHLRGLPGDAVAGVTGLGLVEHIPFAALVDVVDHALRVIEPGGVLLLEAPNPANLLSRAAAFSIDETPARPLHPDVLQFLLEQRGFVDVRVHYLSPADTPPFIAPRINGSEDPFLQRMVDHLNWTFFGPTHYAVSARRP
jgi:O-antigen chain-terminating methyltransferase